MRCIASIAIVMAAALGSAPASAAQNDSRLVQLFAALKAAPSASTARTLEAEIARIWAESSDPETQQLMRKGLSLMARHENPAALKASMADIAHTLKLEPRHFGALAGLGQVELALGNKAAALNAFDQALAIDPYLGDVPKMAERLRKELAGKPI
jgi:tetratricopeptide (TPR) repeat protein